MATPSSLNFEAVIISGDLVEGTDIILKSLRSAVNKRALSYPKKRVEIITSKLTKDGVAVGAATLIMKALFDLEQDFTLDISL